MTAVMLVAIACLGIVAILDLDGEAGGGVSPGVLLSSADTHAHLKHLKHKGSKYQRELSSLAKRAGPDRRQALKNLEQLRDRSEGKDVRGKGGREPAALREMENLAHRRAHSNPRGAEGLGQLERSHGIKSSKDMLAEIMSLRHYHKSNQEIKNIANGFETHSSFSHKVQSSIDQDEQRSREQKERGDRKSAAAALRLEAGRVSRKQMMQATERASEATIAKALSQTLKPIQALLHRDEITLDGMLSKKQERDEEERTADDASARANDSLMRTLDHEVKRDISAKEIALEHKSAQYLNKVHAKAKAALTKVVNPDTVSSKDYVQSSKATTSSPWSSKVEAFLKNTEHFMSKHSNSWLGMSTGPKVSHKAEDTVIAATQANLENQLRSVQQAAGKQPAPQPAGGKGTVQQAVAVSATDSASSHATVGGETASEGGATGG
eukprot:CAMPEP_0181296456 /NCGR_PEP_ID=MMETSP1101-20121128/4714_1 /TAXON_ID=46948 /ORGANISM="Rhodomonas abbreviata, Strain Caron Lab Isolate" /LENGTH=437 /DNA_ID=CAMNT_0023401323 /DNA_START=100 /DNA_END=1410 /DNA_ORIENTATION=+